MLNCKVGAIWIKIALQPIKAESGFVQYERELNHAKASTMFVTSVANEAEARPYHIEGVWDVTWYCVSSTSNYYDRK